MLSYTFCLTLMLIAVKTVKTQLVRQTEYGPVRGKLETSRANSNVQYYAFRGIPYGKPPVGKLRFMDPEKPEKWTGIKDTLKDPELCAQVQDFPLINNGLIGIEDCLYLNVFIPKNVGEHENLAVMFWIHGGAYLSGGAAEYGPEYLMQKPVILVVINYRLTIFGFLSSQDGSISGNMGLKDQVMALKWVQNNIRNFNGNPQSVTIFGASAGGSSTDLLTLSPMAKGLFHASISQSGTSISSLNMAHHPREVFFRLSRSLGINDTDTLAIRRKMQQLDYLVLLNMTQQLFPPLLELYGSPYIHAVVEKGSKNPFLSDSPYKLLKSGRFSNTAFMTGYVSEEGALFYSGIATHVVSSNILVENPQLLVPSNLNQTGRAVSNTEAIRRISEYYFKDGNFSSERNIIHFAGYNLISSGGRLSLKFHTLRVPTYLYKFTYPGGVRLSYLGGTGHYQDVQFLFMANLFASGIGNLTDPNPSEEQLMVRERMLTLWTNFAIYRNPTPVSTNILQGTIWPEAGSIEKPRALIIGANLSLDIDPDGEDMEFWRRLSYDG